MTILIAIDSSRASQCVLEQAATRPWPANTLFTIVNVVDLYRFAYLPAIVDDARREATTLLRQATDKLSRTGCKVNSEVLLGFPRNEIAAFARSGKPISSWLDRMGKEPSRAFYSAVWHKAFFARLRAL